LQQRVADAQRERLPHRLADSVGIYDNVRHSLFVVDCVADRHAEPFCERLWQRHALSICLRERVADAQRERLPHRLADSVGIYDNVRHSLFVVDCVADRHAEPFCERLWQRHALSICLREQFADAQRERLPHRLADSVGIYDNVRHSLFVVDCVADRHAEPFCERLWQRHALSICLRERVADT
jgi:uncharacterized protein YifE (UPF0438 family)